MATRTQVAVVATIVLVAVVAAVVIAFGIRPYPDLPTVAAQPTPRISGSLAYVGWEDRGSCLYVADPSGSVRDVSCEQQLDGPVRWVDGLIEVHRFGRGGAEVVHVDPATGELTVVATNPREHEPVRPPDRATRADGARAQVTSRDGVARLEVRYPDGGTDILLELEGPRNYRFDDPAWSQDGEWITVLDSGERIIVVPADDGEPARIWVSDGAWGAAVG